MLATAPAPPPEPLPAVVRRALRRDLRAVVAAGAPGAIVRVQRGRLSWSAAAGRADLATGRPMRPGLRVRVGSLTKSFVATAVLRLVAAGRLHLRDTVQRWLPGILPYGDRVTVRDLLRHTGGVPDDLLPTASVLYAGDRRHRWTPRQLVGLVAEQPRERARFAYSNTGYTLAGMIVERVTGQPLGRVLERRIARPLHLRDTAFPVHATGIAGPHAHGYSLARDARLAPRPGPLVDFTRFDPSLAWGAGNAISTAGDVGRFFGALLGGRLLPARELAAMERTVPTGQGNGSRYGLGLFAFRSPCGRVWGNDGDIAGFSTRAMATRNGRRGAEVVINADAAPDAVEAPLERLDDDAACAAVLHH
jgi:D-alanyl-D-alanine carboxypeptidase